MAKFCSLAMPRTVLAFLGPLSVREVAEVPEVDHVFPPSGDHRGAIRRKCDAFHRELDGETRSFAAGGRIPEPELTRLFELPASGGEQLAVGREGEAERVE